MSTLIYILVFTFIGSICSLFGGFILLAKEKAALKWFHLLVSFAAGTLLGAAFFDLFPEAIATSERNGVHNNDFSFFMLLGIVVFFIIERFIHWFHHHEEKLLHDSDTQSKNVIPLIVIGDTVHNFIDGIVIAATFLIDIKLGIITSLAVSAHEIPRELGDFGLMLYKKVPKQKVIIMNVSSAFAAFGGAILTYIVGQQLTKFIPIFLSMTAGFFVYIALSDLIPEIHHEKRKHFAFYETILFVAGMGIIWASVTLLEH